jgi:hypothetical protein
MGSGGAEYQTVYRLEPILSSYVHKFLPSVCSTVTFSSRSLTLLGFTSACSCYTDAAAGCPPVRIVCLAAGIQYEDVMYLRPGTEAGITAGARILRTDVSVYVLCQLLCSDITAWGSCFRECVLFFGGGLRRRRCNPVFVRLVCSGYNTESRTIPVLCM